jgi:hypothetical protein
MRERSFSVILDSCLQRLDQGENLPDLLADFPELADQLKPLLLVAMASRAFPVPLPSQTAQRLGRNQMLAEMNRLEIKKAFRYRPAVPLASRWIGGLAGAIRDLGFTHLAYNYRLAMVSLVLVLSGGFFTLSASAASQPGDVLYPLRLGMQRAGLVLPYQNEDPGEGDGQFNPITLQPGKLERSIWILEGLSSGYQHPGDGGSDQSAGSAGVFSAVDLIEEEKETIKDLKEAEKEAEKDLKEAEKEAEKDLKEPEKEDKKELKDAEKDLAEEEKEADKELKEIEKDIKKGAKIK